jgi:hypothetical protein
MVRTLPAGEHGVTPRRLKNDIIGHQFVTPDWVRFNPTNSVNHKKVLFTYIPSNTLATTNTPAIRRNNRSRLMGKLLPLQE